jgi:hypothetical protein
MPWDRDPAPRRLSRRTGEGGAESVSARIDLYAARAAADLDVLSGLPHEPEAALV